MTKWFGNLQFRYFKLFWKYLGYRLIVLLILSVFVALMDGIGLAMFIPLLNLVSDVNQSTNVEGMGELAFIVDFIQGIGVELTLKVVLLTMLLFFCLKGVFKWLELYAGVLFQNYFVRGLRLNNVNSLTQYKYSTFVNADVGQIQNSLTGEVGRVSSAYRSYSNMLRQFVMVIVYSTLAMTTNFQFSMMVALGGIATNFLFKYFYRKTTLLSVSLTNANHKFQGLLIQMVMHFKFLKATSLISPFADKLNNEIWNLDSSLKRIGFLDSLMQGLREPLLMGVIVSVIYIEVDHFGGSLATIILSIVFFYRAFTSVMLLQGGYNNFLSYYGSLENMEAFTQELTKNHEVYGGRAFEGLTGDVLFENVSFGYDDKLVIDDFSLTIPYLKTVALVGESGSGKTTLVNLITGLLSKSEGAIRINGVEIQEYDLKRLRGKIGYITQDPVVFDDSIYNNITFWKPKTKENLLKFERVIQQSHIVEYMDQLELREDTELGNNGISLSGGQKQRISIARELFRDAEILIMDEATSALDSETENEIKKNIDELNGAITIVMIAHRLSTIKNVDKVVVLDKGKIECEGSYQEVLKDSDIFKRMVNLQKL